ncbi:hypothetical protein SAMD00019534_056510 [Acytostelium subglobosum LB1]|uniref:hypothetical protein n=1 Tax=Acytostelium subglobosum LB1 TaxID=1410327 RepID=UPI0006448D7A|nr:hypothetical protein SAMD00019534_056510 [Acytostelium subglobosum LB1]GAM22476.1 hypothetical protein SAMD00019534_056510 [Acytostelium subglobosum LB1]|eukprot:XP_012754596.1 hypothetical protein SAMD00019534_056510 [Acytostelium subglobosum LB1]
MDLLMHLESLTFDFSPSCGHDHADIMYEGVAKTFYEELILFMRRRPSLHTFIFHNSLESNNDAHHQPFLEYLLQDGSCPVQHVSLRTFCHVPLLGRQIDTLILIGCYEPDDQHFDKHMEMFINNLKTCVTNILDLSDFTFIQVSKTDNALIDTMLQPGIFLGNVYKHPDLNYRRYNE